MSNDLTEKAKVASEDAFKPGAPALGLRIRSVWSLDIGHWSLVISFLLSVGSLQAAVAETADQRFVAGLRERRLFELAEAYCLRRMQDAGLSPRRQAELAIELTRSYAEHALHTPPASRTPVWDRAHQVAADFEAKFPTHGRLILVRLQDALTSLAEGELARQEAEVPGVGEAQFDAARQHLRRAIAQLEQVERQIAELLRRSHGRRSASDQSTPAELEALERNVSFQLARAYRNQGQCYAAGSADRTNSLSLALERLAPLAELPLTDDVVSRSRFDRVVCYRLLGDTARADQALDALLKSDPPPEVASRAAAEAIRLHLAAGRIEQALQEAARDRPHAKPSADLDFARLETLVAASRAAAREPDEAKAADLQRQAAGQVRRIEDSYGPYWMRRAEMLLASTVSGTGAEHPSALIRAAEGFYRARQMAKALETYDRALEKAIEQGNVEQAFQAGFTAATIEHQAGRHQEALQRYRRLAVQLSDHPRAGEAHRLAILNAAKLTRSADPAERPAWLRHYADLLDEHLATWPRAASGGQVRYWLGKLRTSRRDWPGAIAAYRTVDPDDPHYAEAVRAAARCYELWLAALQQSGKPRADVAREARQFLAGVLFGPARRWPKSLTPLARWCVVALAKIQLDHTAGGYAEAQRLLSTALQLASDAPDDWRSESRSLLVSSLAAQGRTDEAAGLIREISAGPVESQIRLLGDLEALLLAAKPEARRPLAELVLGVVALVEPHRAEIQGEPRRRLATSRAAALAATGKHEQALRAYDELVRKYPADGAVQEARANLLLAMNDPATLQSALNAWHDVAKRSHRGSDRWFRARLALAETYHRLGRNDEASKLIKLTQLLHPELGGAEMQVKFRDLLAACEK